MLREKRSKLPPGMVPAMLTEEAAAEYCQISLALFRTTCPVKPRDMRKGHGDKPCLRWSVAKLNRWLEDDDTPAGRFDDMLGKLGT